MTNFFSLLLLIPTSLFIPHLPNCLSSFLSLHIIPLRILVRQMEFQPVSLSSESHTSPARTSSSSCTNTSPEAQVFSSPDTNLSLNILPSDHIQPIISPSIFQPCIVTLHTPQVSFLALHEGSLYAGCLNQINVFDMKNHGLVDNFSCKNPNSGLVKSIAFIESKVFTAHQDCKIRVWHVTPTRKHHLLSTLPTVKDRLVHCMLPKNYVQVRRHKQKLWIEHADAISGLAMNDRLMYSISWDKSFKIWRTSDLCCLESVKAHADAINTIVVSYDGIVYTGSADGKIKVWEKPACDKQKHVLLCSLEKHSSSVNALALNKNGSMLFSGGCDKNILVWEREDGVNHMVFGSSLKGHRGAILCLNYVNDLLISGSSDRTLRVWKYDEGSGYGCMAILEGHLKPIKSIVAFPSDSSDGVVSIFSGSIDGEIKVWQISEIFLSSLK